MACMVECYSPDISIHTLRMEGDRFKPENVIQGSLFQSTPSAWRVTWILYSYP